MFRRLCGAVHRQLQVTATVCIVGSPPPVVHTSSWDSSNRISVSSISADDPSSLTASSLARSCGLSDHAALSICKKFQIDVFDKVLPVLALLKDYYYGFDEAHIVRLCPRFLLMDVKTTQAGVLPLDRARRNLPSGDPVSETLAARLTLNPAWRTDCSPTLCPSNRL